jgi:catechol 2,3-dioxygenase-like lactoylglutathione lyase family enzyme
MLLRRGPAVLLLALAPALPAAQDATPAAAARPRVYGISHVSLRVSDRAAADGFYTGRLGLPGGMAGGCQVYTVGSRQAVTLDIGLPAGEDERLVAVGFVTESRERLGAYLRAKGHAASDAVRCGRPVLRVPDPEGHLIEFIDPAPWPASAAAGGSIGRRILHAGLTVRDVATMDRFYAEVLGFSEIWRGGRTDAVVDWINMKVPDGTEYIEYMLVGSEPLTRTRLGSMHHIALVVDDMQVAYEAVLARVPAGQAASVGSPRVGRNRRWQLNLFDPDGTRTELMELYPMR